MLVYDVTARDSFVNLTEWLKEIEIWSTREDVVQLLVGNKIDLVSLAGFEIGSECGGRGTHR